MLAPVKTYLRAPVFPGDDDKTFTASLLHVILWSLLVGISLYTLVAMLFSIIQPHMLFIAWLYVLALGGLTLALMLVMRRGHVRQAAIAVNIGLWIIITAAAYFNGGVAAPAYSGYLVVIICASLLIGWHWGLALAIVSSLAGAIFLLAAQNGWLPEWSTTYSFGAVWSANIAYFFAAAMLLALALRAIQRALQQMRQAMAERLLFEQALSQSEQRFRAIFDTVNDAIFVQDLQDGRILEVNQRMSEMYGYAADEVRHLTVEDLSAGYPPYTQHEVLAWLQRAANGEPQIFEWRAKDRAGRLFWVEINMRRAAIGGQDRLLVVVRDIDDRKRAEETLNREQAYYEAIVNATPVMLWLKDRENRILRVNPAAARLEGMDAAELEGKSAFDLYPPEQAEAYYHDDMDVIRSGQPKLGIIEQYATSNGKSIWVEMGKVPARNERGDIVGVLACGIDVTARKEAEDIQVATRQIAEAALLTQNLAEFYPAVHSIISRLIPAHNFYIALYDPARDLFAVPYLVDEFDATWPPYAPRKGLSAYVMRTGEPLLIKAEAIAELLRQGSVEIIDRPMVEWLGVPLKTAQGIVGVMGMQNYSGPARLEDKHKDLLVFVSAQVAMAIERKRAEERDRHISRGLRTVIETAQELINCGDLETLYRRSVELAREKLGLERCGLFLLDEREEFIRGTFGTDDQGRTTDEHAARYLITQHPEVLSIVDRLWISYEGAFNYWQDDREHLLAGQGWNAATPIRSHHRTIGVLYNDTGISHAPLDETQQDIVAVYCSLLGSLIELKRAEEALRDSESTTRALLAAIPDIIFRFDDQGVFKDYIPAKEFAPWQPPEEYIGRPFTQVLPPEVVQPLAEQFQTVLLTGEPRLVEYALATDERARYFESRLVKMAQGDVLGIVRDVTTRKEAELALQQREAYLRSILDNFPYWIWLKDTAGRFLAVNRTLAHTYDFPSGDEMIGRTDDDLTSPELARQYRADDQLVMDSRTQQLVEEIVVEHGVEKWFETFKSPVLDAQGNVIGTAGFSRDVTARRQAEAAIRESEALFRNVADNAPAFIAMQDATGLATYVNRAWREFRGDLPLLPIEEWAERVHPDDRRRYLHEFHSALHEQRKFTAEYRLRRNDGQYRWLLDTSMPHYAADERFAGFIGIAIDITDRKNAEEALRRSESRLRLLTDNMVDSISQIDAQHRLVYVSPSVERVFGHALRDLLGHQLYDFVHVEDAARLRHEIQLAIAQHTPSLRLEYRYQHAASHYVWVESEARLLYDNDGHLATAVLATRDIAARKHIEAERENLIKELEEKNAELERFTYTVSHDLKSPLITIRGFLGFLERDAVAGNLDRLRADIARITEATARMQRLLDELLELSRIGHMNNSPEEVPFGLIAREAVELAHGRLVKRGVHVEIAADLPLVYGDHVRLVEAVQNLVDNAVKFMGDQAEPRIIIGVASAAQTGQPIFFVQDNGIGIEPEYRERIFGLFNKLDARSEGTGVGLALVKRIIETHGGRIWVESAGPGQGAVFYFTLPRAALLARGD